MKSSPEMPPRDDSFTLRVSGSAEHYDYLSDEVDFADDCYAIPCSAEDFSSPGELTVAWEDAGGTMHPAALAAGRAFVGEPREVNDSTGQTAALAAEVDKLSQRVSDNTSAISRNASALASHADTIDTLDTGITTLSTELANRMTGQEWLEAIDEGFRQRDIILSKMKNCHNVKYDHDGLKVYYIKEWATTPLYNLAPYVIPPIEFPELGEGEEFSMQFMFAFCDKLLHVAPMRVPGISLHCTFHFTGLVKAPELDTSHVRDFSSALHGCKNLQSWPDWNLSKAVTLSNFTQGTGITEVPDLDIPDCEEMWQMVWSCPKLRRIGAIKAPNCRDVELTGPNENPYLERIDELDYGHVGEAVPERKRQLYFYSTAPSKLRYLRIINLGKSESSQYFLVVKAWGDGSEENRQSLVDTLLTNSYDRAAAGMPTATVRLHKDAVARLTPEELAAITAKGFTITTVS